jgi:hypothetical protein
MSYAANFGSISSLKLVTPKRQVKEFFNSSFAGNQQSELVESLSTTIPAPGRFGSCIFFRHEFSQAIYGTAV